MTRFYVVKRGDEYFCTNGEEHYWAPSLVAAELLTREEAIRIARIKDKVVRVRIVEDKEIAR